MKKQSPLCPCGSNKPYTDCCARYVDGKETTPTAEALMRSRYTAYTMLREDYLLATWHPSTRPSALGLAENEATKWLDLDVKRHEQQGTDRAIVEFGARYKVHGRAHRLHEVSRFVREEGLWFYVDGEND
ncbi:MAG: hypothetical protein EPO42_07135 [Gallionellaceae bacterium]|nr:MAG: hypothetical protein EPO42_07135 [Gallionellaceae bacterium]